MNQEKIMKRKMYIAITISLILSIALAIFIALYIDEKRNIQKNYKKQYMLNMSETCSEIETYLEKKTDYAIHYNMILSDLGAARSFIFLIDDYSDKNKTAINELFYCFVKYPEQMSEKLEEADEAIGKIVNNIDAGYEDVQKLVDSIDKKGT